MKNSLFILLSAGAALLVGATNDSPADIRRVPAQYSTIQLAIDAAAAGDTVLVSRGTYYENIRFRGKAITVASQYIMDGDTTHIDSTIIDGSRTTNPDSGSTVFFDAGEDSTSVLCGMTITGGTGVINTNFDYRVGGGIHVSPSSGATIRRNRIVFNSVTHSNMAIGAGVTAGSPFVVGGWLILEENEIAHNIATGTKGAGTAGVSCGMNARIERNRIQDNQGFSPVLAGAGGGMYCYTQAVGSLELVVRGNIISGNTMTSTGVNEYGESALGGGLAVSGYRAIVENNVIVDNVLQGPGKLYGGGVLLNWNNDQVQLRSNWIGGNRLIGAGERQGGGVCIWGCSPRLTNNIVVGNEARMGGGVMVGGADPSSRPHIVNNTICGNSAAFGSGLYSALAYPVVVNSILWNQGGDIYQSGGLVTAAYSDVRGGWAGTGNRDVDPGFLDTTYQLSNASPCIGAGIDSLELGGVWYYAPPTCFGGSDRPSPAGTPPDLGACESPLGPTSVPFLDGTIPVDYALGQNYPNPFNPSTTIRYDLPRKSRVTLSIFNMLGQQVASAVDGELEAGHHDVRFDASCLSSGVYLYRLTAGGFTRTRSMLYLK